MGEEPVSDNEQINPLGHLTGQQLKELEQKERIRGQKTLDFVIMVFPVICSFITTIEYQEVPNGSPNSHSYTYVWVVTAFMTAYALYILETGIKSRGGDKRTVEDLCYCASLASAFSLLLTVYDYLTLKTGILSQSFVPCINSVLNIVWESRAYLLERILHTLHPLFSGRFIGIVLGLATGITCGYFEKARYWVNPTVEFLGPIPTTTWILTIMVVAASLFRGTVFTTTLGSWFIVTVASMSGIQNMDKDFFGVAGTLGANERQLVFRVAIPYVVSSILQGCIQVMNSSCVAIMIVEMVGVKAGLGWYMNWVKSWAAYDKMFAALFVICFILAIVTEMLDLIKRRILRWQNGVMK